MNQKMNDADTGGAAPPENVETINPAPSGEEPAAPSDDDPIVKLRRENAAWRSRAKALEGLHPDELEALDPFFQAVRRGDDEMVRQWIAAQYQHMFPDAAGADLGPTGATAPVRQPAAVTTAQVVAASQANGDQPLTKAELERILAERDRQAQAAAERAEAQRRIMDECREAGLDPTSPHAKAVFAMARQMMIDQDRPVPISEAFAEYKRSLSMFVAATPPASTPATPEPGTPGVAGVPPPPAGVAGVEDRWLSMTPAQRAQERIRLANQA
jgi:hypothetical protein